MEHNDTAPQRWSVLDGERSSLKYRSEKYAAFTVPKVCTPEGYEQNNTELQHDWQALGAQAVNNLVNKLMLALFAPSRPFFRLEADNKTMKYFIDMGATAQQVTEALSIAEKEAIKEMDKRSLRPKLLEVLKHLIVVGNVLFFLDKVKTRVISMKNYVCKRAVDGTVLEIIMRDCMTYQQLDKDIRDIPDLRGRKDTDKLTFYKWIRLDENNEYRLTQWVDGIVLPEKYDGKWQEDNLPYRCLTWDLSDNADYGTGYVEDYVGDFEALSALSKAQVQGAILASEFRWLVNPQGMTKPEDLQNSVNGQAIPGNQGDITLVNAQTQNALGAIQNVANDYIQRISRGFLMMNGITRNAERVTAEEIRMQANELETGIGGAYSRIAVDLQVPFSRFLLKLVDFKFKGKSIQPIVITGLDALSRSADADNIKLWIGDMAQVIGLPPMFKKGPIASSLASAYGIQSSDFMVSEQEQEQMRQQEAQAQQQAQMQEQIPNQEAAMAQAQAQPDPAMAAGSQPQ